MMAGLYSCRSVVQYVPVETVRTDSIYLSSLQLDSVFVHDSILINQKGDTVTEYRYRYVYKYKDRVDTLYINKTDSISVPYPVEKSLTRWEQTKVNYGGHAIIAVVVIVMVVFGKMIYKLKK
ncbi:hypothetical protein [Parabacteroides chongii]|uniref:hypothetical protein n=1 Tax=Parabacteroides chongii TaxID=2685834 RepID=UPI00240DA739|nr:hypothetical protein [Parabacteroides chongii]WFE84964.1 hypothetical protein P3L47_23075 [Parabacteroides chongii]